jgi:hypothetical protein
MALAAILCNPAYKIEALHLKNTEFGDEGVIILASGIANNSTLNELCIQGNDDDDPLPIAESGWSAIFSALCSPMCRLEKLN